MTADGGSTIATFVSGAGSSARQLNATFVGQVITGGGVTISVAILVAEPQGPATSIEKSPVSAGGTFYIWRVGPDGGFFLVPHFFLSKNCVSPPAGATLESKSLLLR